jgi:ArsR family transcriptional regulator, arsenate/arsenite/antimonite-responsive transcriptional repressor
VSILSDIFKALSDETRVQIMTLLLERDELCVCDFVGALGETQSKVSRHLRYLYHSGLVKDRRAGLWMHYRISDELGPEQIIILGALSEAVSEAQREALRRSLEQWFARKGSEFDEGEEGPPSCCDGSSGNDAKGGDS